MKTKLFILLIALAFSFGVSAQGIVNNGAKIVITTGTTVFIDGDANANYVNSGAGEIDLDGTLKIEGDFTNNATTNAFRNVGTDGEVVFAGATQTITSNAADMSNYIDFEKVTINSGSSTTLTAGSAMTANGVLDIDGTFTSATPSDETSGGSLITATGAGGVTGTGTLNINRFFKVNGRWQYVSAPMSGQQSDIFTENTTSGNFNTNFYTLNEAFDQTALADPNNTNYSNYDYGSGYNFWEAWSQVQATAGAPVAINSGVGYICYNEGDITANFTTTTPSNINNNASYAPAVSFTSNDCGNIASSFYDGWNLIGNPYQSAIDWNNAGWTKTNITGTVYMWDGDNGNYIYYSSDASQITGTGQTLNSDANAQYIPAMQSFIVKATAAAPALSIPAAARTHNSNQMYKSAKDDVINFDYIKLKTTNSDNQSDEMIVRFLDNATAQIDDDFDAYKFYSTTAGLPQAFSIVSETPIAINSLPLPENTEDIVSIPLGVVAKADGNYTFTAKELNLVNIDKVVFVDVTDPENNTQTVFTEGDEYTCYIPEGEVRGRFFLYFTPGDVTDVFDNKNASAGDVKIYSDKNKVYLNINSKSEINGTVEIYNLLGQQILNTNVASNFSDYTVNQASGTYIVKFKNDSKTYTQKVFIQR